MVCEYDPELMADEVLYENDGGRGPRDDQSSRAAQRDVVRSDAGSARRVRARSCRRRRARRRAHRRGRQGVLRGRRPRRRRHRRRRGIGARRPRSARRPVPRHVAARQAGDRARARLRARRRLRPRVRVRPDRRVRRRGVRHARDQRRAVAVHDHRAVAALDAAEDRARPDDDRAARRAPRRARASASCSGSCRSPSSTRRSTRSRPSSRRSRRSSCAGAATRSTGCSRWTPTPRSSYLQGMLTDHVADRGRGRGGRRVRREARAAVEGTVAMADPRHDWGPLVGDLAAAQGARARDGRREARRAPALARQADGPRAPRPAPRSRARGSSTGCSPTTWTPGLGDRYLAADGAVTGVGEIDGRLVAIAAYDFTVMAGSMGAVGEDKIARMRAHAVRQRIPFVWLLDSAGARIQSTSGSTFAGAGALFREQVAMSGVVPMVAAMLGHCAAGTAYIPGARRLRADGEGHVVDGARRPPSREGRGRRGRHRGGDGRLRGAHQDLGRRRPRGRRRRGVPARRARLPVVLPAAQPRAAAGARDRPIPSTAAPRSSTTSCRPRRARAYDVRKVVHAIVDDGDVFWMKPEWAKNLVTGLGARRRPAGRHRREPADGARRRARRERGRQGGAVRVAVRRVQHPARVPARRARASSSAPRSRSRASSATAPRCCSR